jgi:hypothetical protein
MSQKGEPAPCPVRKHAAVSPRQFLALEAHLFATITPDWRKQQIRIRQTSEEESCSCSRGKSTSES